MKRNIIKIMSVTVCTLVFAAVLTGCACGGGDGCGCPSSTCASVA